jgi:hypothetical protein
MHAISSFFMSAHESASFYQPYFEQGDQIYSKYSVFFRNILPEGPVPTRDMASRRGQTFNVPCTSWTGVCDIRRWCLLKETRSHKVVYGVSCVVYDQIYRNAGIVNGIGVRRKHVEGAVAPGKQRQDGGARCGNE